MEEDLSELAKTAAKFLHGDTDKQYRNIKSAWQQNIFKETKIRPDLTPLSLISEHLDGIGSFVGMNVLTPNIEYVPSLVNGGAQTVTLLTKDKCVKAKNLVTSPTFGLEALYTFNSKLETRMTDKYDIVIGNPPYRGQSKLHQKFFNLAVNMVKKGGIVSFIQPATAYFNKKTRTDAPSQKMRDNVKKYKTEVKILKPDIFKNVTIRGDLAITKLVKTNSESETIEKITYSRDKVFRNIDLENITKTELEPSMYASIKTKYEAYVKNNGSLIRLQTLDKSALKARLPARMTEDAKSWPIFFLTGTCANNGAHGILASTEKEVEFIYQYLMTNPARFGLALLMFSTDLKGGALGLVPLVDFNRVWTDEEIYDLIGLSATERQVIDSTIPDYYSRKNPKDSSVEEDQSNS